MGPQAEGCRRPPTAGEARKWTLPWVLRRRTDSPAATVWTSDFQNCTIIFFFFFFFKPVDAFFVTAAGESSYALSRVATHNLQTTC